MASALEMVNQLESDYVLLERQKAEMVCQLAEVRRHGFAVVFLHVQSNSVKMARHTFVRGAHCREVVRAVTIDWLL